MTKPASTRPCLVAIPLVVALLAVLSTRATAKDHFPESGRSYSVYRGAGEAAAVAPADVAPIYVAALRFYRPPRNQSRWLDPGVLPESPGDTTSRTLDHGLVTDLVAKLGDRFCPLGAPCSRGLTQGAELRVSRIYAATPNEARIVVACRTVWEGVSTSNSAQSFSLVRTPQGWVVADRGGAGSAP